MAATTFTTRYAVRLTGEGWQIFDEVELVFLADAFGEWWHALEEGDRLNRSEGRPIQ